MKIAVGPPVDESARSALETVLSASGFPMKSSSRYDDSWRDAAFREGVERDELEERYAPSPRSTRGATRA